MLQTLSENPTHADHVLRWRNRLKGGDLLHFLLIEILPTDQPLQGELPAGAEVSDLGDFTQNRVALFLYLLELVLEGGTRRGDAHF